MQSVAKFVTKAYPVSGCFDYLSEVRTRRERSVCACVCACTRFPRALWSRAGVRRVTTFLLSVWTRSTSEGRIGVAGPSQQVTWCGQWRKFK